MVFGHPEGTWCGGVWSSWGVLVWWYLVILGGPGVVVFDHPGGTWHSVVFGHPEGGRCSVVVFDHPEGTACDVKVSDSSRGDLMWWAGC